METPSKIVRFVGDIHGDFGWYQRIIEDAETSVQVGDYGVGFDTFTDDRMEAWGKENLQHRFIRGNHDDKMTALRMENFIPDGSYDHQNNLMYVGGAWSIDYAFREEGKNWWHDEECSTAEFSLYKDLYTRFKPRIMVTHDCPMQIIEKANLLNPAFGGKVNTRTGFRLGQMFHLHKPKLWIFGHWHKPVDMVIGDTRFICLDIGQSVDINLDTLEDVCWG